MQRFKNISELARHIGISAAMVSMIRSGARRPSWQRALALSEATGADPSVFMGGSQEEVGAAIDAAIEVRPV